MDTASRYAVTALEALALTSRRLTDLAVHLRSQPDVTQALHDLSVSTGGASGSIIEGYVDVELRSGKAVAWLLDVTWNEMRWTIRSEIVVNHELGQDTLRRFPDRTAEKLDEFVLGLNMATRILVESAEALNLDTLTFTEPLSDMGTA